MPPLIWLRFAINRDILAPNGGVELNSRNLEIVVRVSPLFSFAAVLLPLILAAVGCGSGSESHPRGATNGAESVDVEEGRNALVDGTYSCTVSNVSRGNGPYSLECEKSGSEVVIHFPSGGYLSVDIDTESVPQEGTVRFEGTDQKKGDAWEIEIER